ncbi:MAG: hypothetical protein IJP82_02300 [Bacteroidaceae bacterium]|nr:hypothetical protein [Bacteroidaceae bacterium]
MSSSRGLLCHNDSQRSFNAVFRTFNVKRSHTYHIHANDKHFLGGLSLNGQSIDLQRQIIAQGNGHFYLIYRKFADISICRANQFGAYGA